MTEAPQEPMFRPSGGKGGAGSPAQDRAVEQWVHRLN